MANIEKCGISLVWMEGKFPKDDHMAYKKKKEGNTNPSQTGGHGGGQKKWGMGSWGGLEHKRISKACYPKNTKGIKVDTPKHLMHMTLLHITHYTQLNQMSNRAERQCWWTQKKLLNHILSMLWWCACILGPHHLVPPLNHAILLPLLPSRLESGWVYTWISSHFLQLKSKFHLANFMW